MPDTQQTAGGQNGANAPTVRSNVERIQVCPPKPWCEQSENRAHLEAALRYFPFFDGLCEETNVTFVGLLKRIKSQYDNSPVNETIIWSEDMKVATLNFTKVRFRQIQSGFRAAYRGKSVVEMIMLVRYLQSFLGLTQLP
jgi:hypothetical protein